MRWPVFRRPRRRRPICRRGGKIRIGMRVQEVKDPQTISWVEPSNVLRNTVQYLTRTDQNNVTHPELLEKWEASEDLKTWTLTIHPDAKWRSGRPFTADDAIWNIKRVLDPKTGSSVLGLMKGYMLEQYDTGEVKDGKPVKSVRLWSENAIEKINDKTFRLNCKEAQLAVPEHLFHYPFFMLDPAENAAFKAGMNGTGPFELDHLQCRPERRVASQQDLLGQARPSRRSRVHRSRRRRRRQDRSAGFQAGRWPQRSGLFATRRGQGAAGCRRSIRRPPRRQPWCEASTIRSRSTMCGCARL